MSLGDAAFNVDEYVSKLITYIGGRHNIDREARDRNGTMDWSILGRVATGICRRPPTIEFMLGPLSVEKKERKITRRQVERRDNASIVRPQEALSFPIVLISS
jgi:non-structural maintenance of chromosomes element 4